MRDISLIPFGSPWHDTTQNDRHQVLRCNQYSPATGSDKTSVDDRARGAAHQDATINKWLGPGFADSIPQRANILKEVQIMRQLDHPNIVKLIDFSESKQYYYIILELAPGGELFHQIVRLTYFSEDLSRHVIVQVAKALEYLHEERGVVHRYVPHVHFPYPFPAMCIWFVAGICSPGSDCYVLVVDVMSCPKGACDVMLAATSTVPLARINAITYSLARQPAGGLR